MTSIPKHLHQVWLGSKPIPKKFLDWRDNWRQLHPDWQYTLWIDSNTNRELDPLLKRCKSLSSKSNVVRLWAIKEYGGVYVDMDFNWNKNIDKWLQHKAFAAKEKPQRYCNAFFGAVPNHPWINRQFQLLDKYVDKRPPWGPTLMTVCSHYEPELWTIPTNLVYPYLWNSPYREAYEFKDSYLVHHWDKSWY